MLRKNSWIVEEVKPEMHWKKMNILENLGNFLRKIIYMIGFI